MIQKISSSRLGYFLWLLPFVGFASGYVLATYLLHKTDLETPSVIGKSLSVCAQILSQHRLGLRLLEQREDALLPESTVIDQIPHPTQRIRPNQNVFITISTKQKPIIMPDLWTKRAKEATDELAKMGLQVQPVYINAPYPKGLCIAQHPSLGHELGDKNVLIYLSQGNKTLFIMPDCKNRYIKDIEDLLYRYDVRAEIIHSQPLPEKHSCDQCKIINQHPAAGAIVDLSKTLHVQLEV